MFLPILTVDAHRLSPSFGYLFDLRWIDPHESIVSLLWKYVRANGIPGHAVVTEFSREPVDPYDGIEAHREAVDIPRLIKGLGITRKILYEALIPAHRCRALHPSLRYCPLCLSRGYHSVVHQFEKIGRCPIHDRPLETVCRHCGYTSPYRLTARLLETPFACPECHSLHGTQRVSVFKRVPMPMKDLVPMTRARIARCRY